MSNYHTVLSIMSNEVREDDRNQILGRPYVGGHRKSLIDFNGFKPGEQHDLIYFLNINFDCSVGTKLTILARE